MTAQIPTGRTLVTTTVQLTPDQYEACQALAARTHRSLAAVVREAVDRLLERERRIQALEEEVPA